MGAGRIAATAAMIGSLALTGCSAASGAKSAPPAAPLVHPTPGQPTAGLVPAQVSRAYNLGPLRRRAIEGAHQTIVIVDSFGSPTITHDLAAFDTAFGLRAPASLRIIQAGRVPPYRPTSNRTGWASETTLDVEWAHAMAPAAGIVLVETPTAENEGITGFPQIVMAEKYALNHHLGQVISQSFGATEETFRSPAQLRSQRGAYRLAARDRVTVLAASGDNGASGETYSMHSVYGHPVTEWPATDPLVTAVGGTAMQLDRAGGRLAPDIAWSDGGGGRSAVFPRPAYQHGVRGLAHGGRAIPDISMNASCTSSVATYASYPGIGGHWQTVCGTSLATPLFAGVVAMADQVAGHSLGLINPAIYRMLAARDRGLADVTSGANSVNASRAGKVVTIRGFRARPGYDLVSGAGTINAAYFVPELARLAASPVLALLIVAAAVGLSNLAASIGLGVPGVDAAKRIRVGLVFGVFEAGMPVVGLLLGQSLADEVGSASQWLGGAMLVAVGLYPLLGPVIRRVRRRRQAPDPASAAPAPASPPPASPPPGRRVGGLGKLLLSGLALSLDNLVIGFALGTYRTPILLSALVIGAVSVAMSLAGLEIGAHLGRLARRSRWPDQSGDQLGGALLIMVGIAVAAGVLT